jgi:hypothetical protein
MSKIFSKSIRAMALMTQAYKLLEEDWDEAIANDTLDLYEGDILSVINEANIKASSQSWEESAFTLLGAKEELEALQVIKHDLCIERIWEEFGDIHINEDDEIMTHFINWTEYTNRQVIWEWFDKEHSKGVAFLMYGDTSKKLAWATPTSRQEREVGILRFVNNEYEIIEDTLSETWTLIHMKSQNRWTRDGIGKGDVMKAIAEGFSSK